MNQQRFDLEILRYRQLRHRPTWSPKKPGISSHDEGLILKPFWAGSKRWCKPQPRSRNTTMGSELESRDAWWGCDLKVWIETRNPKKCSGVSIHANPISEPAGLSHQLVPWSITTDSMTAATEKKTVATSMIVYDLWNPTKLDECTKLQHCHLV